MSTWYPELTEPQLLYISVKKKCNHELKEWAPKSYCNEYIRSVRDAFGLGLIVLHLKLSKL